MTDDIVKALQSIGFQEKLARLYKNQMKVDGLLGLANISDPMLPTFSNAPNAFYYWLEVVVILSEGNVSHGLLRLAQRVHMDYPDNKVFKKALIILENSSEHTGPQTILAIASNPHTLPTSVLRSEREFKAIQDAFEHRDDVKLVLKGQVSFEDLPKLLAQYRPTLLHISSHGEADAEGHESLVISNRKEEAVNLKPEQIRKFIGAINQGEPGPIQCVVFNTCHSSDLARSIASVPRAAIGFKDRINDGESARFATGFYEALAHGHSLRTAFDLGSAKLNVMSRNGRQGLHSNVQMHTRRSCNVGDLILFAESC